jgi:hypothetical protein
MTVRSLPIYDTAADPFVAANRTTSGAMAAQQKPEARIAGHLCRRGCKLRYNFAVSRLIGTAGARRVLWYRHIDHRNRHAGAPR